MRRNKLRILSILMMIVMMFASLNITSFAASGIGGEETLSTGSAQIALYQNGDLGAAYDGDDIYASAASYEQGTIEYVIYNGMKSLSPLIDVSSFNLPIETALDAYRQVINNNPDLF